MAMASGVVTNISSKGLKSKSTGKPFTVWRFEVDGEWYSFGFNKPAFIVGDTIEFEYVENKYGREVPKGSRVAQVEPGITSAFAPASTSTPATKPVSKGFPVKEFPLPLLHPDRCIVRQNMLRHATDIVNGTASHSENTTGEKAHEVIRIARILEQYATGYDVVEAIEKETE